jgi:4'-phosphopantetheinyl transferase EntD
MITTKEKSVVSFSSKGPLDTSTTTTSNTRDSNSINTNDHYHSYIAKYEQYYHCFFDHQVPEGRCVGIQLLPVPNDHIHSLRQDHLLQSTTEPDENPAHPHHRHWLFDFLHPEEIQYGLQLHHINHRQSFYMGRLAIRHALQQPPPPPASTEEDGMPSLLVQNQSYHPDDATIGTSKRTINVSSSQMLSTSSASTSFRVSDDTKNRNIGVINNNNSSLSIRSSILKDMYGRPLLPNGYLGSISHKGSIGVALVQNVEDQYLHHQQIQLSSGAGVGLQLPLPTPRMGIGVDIEDISHAHLRRNVARKVLTPHEVQNLGTLTYQYHHGSSTADHSKVHCTKNESMSLSTGQGSSQRYLSIEEEILLRFSCKESVYKAIHPLLNQYVSFQEAEIQPYINGTAAVTLKLAPTSSKDRNVIQKQEQQFRTPIIAHWYRHENYIITTACISLQ